MTTKAIVRERGNGLAGVGDYVAGDDGEVYVVTAVTGPIHMARNEAAHDSGLRSHLEAH